MHHSLAPLSALVFNSGLPFFLSITGVVPATTFLKESGLPITGRGEVLVDKVKLNDLRDLLNLLLHFFFFFFSSAVHESC